MRKRLVVTVIADFLLPARKQMLPHCHVRATLCCVYADDGKIAIVYAIVPLEGVDKLLCHYSSPWYTRNPCFSL